MNDVLLTPIRLNELEVLIQNSVERAIKAHIIKTIERIEKSEQLLTVQEAAQFLNLKVPTIYSKVSKGELPFMKRSKRLYFSSTELMEYIKEGRIKTNAKIELEAEEYLSNKNKGQK